MRTKLQHGNISFGAICGNSFASRSFSRQGYRFHLFSNLAGEEELKPANTRLSSSAVDLLRATGDAAQDIACEDESSPLQAATEAAQNLLLITSPPQPLAESVLSGDDKVKESISKLHRSLLLVTKRCIAIIPKNPDFLIPLAMRLVYRARDLSLPLNLPIYRDLVTMIAAHSVAIPPGAEEMIVEVSVLAGSALKAPLQASFFSRALSTLVEKNRLREVLLLRQSMMDRHDIEEIDPKAAKDMIVALKENFQRSREHPSFTVDNADATEIVLLSYKLLGVQKRHNDALDPLIDVLRNLNIEETNEELDDEFSSDEEDDSYADEDDNYADEDEEDGSEDAMDSEMAFWDNKKETDLGTDLRSYLSQLVKKADDNRAERRGSTLVSIQIDEKGNIQKFSSSRPPLDDYEDDEIPKGMAEAMVYSRDAKDWKLPDVTEQLMSLNDGEQVRYTHDYEEQLLEALANEMES